MTSYANEAKVTSARTTTQHNDGAGTLTAAAATEEQLQTQTLDVTGFNKMSSPAILRTNLDSYCDEYFSDGREKTDTTPENIKKIDELIGQANDDSDATAHTSSPYLTPRSFNTSDTADDATVTVDRNLNFSSVGLGAAVDDSNAQICLAKTQQQQQQQPDKLCDEKDTVLSKSNKIEAGERSNEETKTTLVNSSSNKNDDGDNRNISNSVGQSNENSLNTSEADDDSSAATTTKQSLAFTIDSFNDKESDPAVQAARYKTMMERFQNRHKRGASMSKLENDNHVNKENTASAHSVRNSYRSSLELSTDAAVLSNSNSVSATPTESGKVKMRVRDRSTSRVRDASKRHSWSPRSSSSAAPETQTVTPTAASTRKSNSAKPSKLPPSATKGAANMLANRTQFTPRSTAMQLALQKVDFLCPEPPLADINQKNMEEDAVSDTGTYTLDGDNYTEEQKDLMNIDRNALAKAVREAESQQLRPTDLPVKTVCNRGNNVLEVSYCHDTPIQEKPVTLKQEKNINLNDASDLILGSHETANAYMCRVRRNIGNLSKPASQVDNDDVGCFTSVTTSGVLAKQRALDTHPKITHCASLSTSQIDSSEYVSNEVKLKHANQLACAGGFTDRQKAAYRLNVFSTSTNNGKDPKFASTRKHITSPVNTSTREQLSDTTILKTAQSKQDWIQEWARNARARSLANDQHKCMQDANQELMTRSYTSAESGNVDSFTDDSIYSQQQYAIKLNKSLAERYRFLAAGECDFASDPALNTHQELPYKPPKSPSKIPSPLHTLGRARSASRTRSSLQHIATDGISSEDYLQKTVAAINNFQQSLSRNNSLKSPTNSASSRPHATHIFTPNERSPQHSLESGSVNYRRSPMHRMKASHDANYTSGNRNTRDSLMTSSINESQLQLLTSGKYLLKQYCGRKNSLDATNVEPHSPVKHYGVQQYATSNNGSSSPLRRSSSFSTTKLMAKQQQHEQPSRRQGRPQFQNIYTPPATRHQYAFTSQPLNPSNQQLKKSASSNNFDQTYSDYDDHLQYYINDVDERGTGDEYYSSDDEVQENGYYQQQQVEEVVPLSNTRLNKALLMRIENSKQKVIGVTPSGGSVGKPSSAPACKTNNQPTIGLMACPNTPELPRRNIRSAPRASTGSNAPTKSRQSMPRDTSLSRLANQVPSSLASAKKQLLLTAYGVQNTQYTNSSKINQRVQPKYMDISKYKSAQSNNFLRKNDAKSTLKAGPPEHIKRSPSVSSMGLSRGDATRVSNRSIRSVNSVMNSSTTSLSSNTVRASSAIRRDTSVNKQKEAEMVMWKRRSTYDPMKSAAEDRRKKEEARRLAQANKQQLAAETNEVPFESPRNSMELPEDGWTLGESSEYEEDIYEQDDRHSSADKLDDVFIEATPASATQQ